MNKLLIITLLLTLGSGQAIAHSGRTDANGGHNCSQKSKDKGLCTGYHYHSDGGFYSDLTEEAMEPAKISLKIGHDKLSKHTHDENTTDINGDPQK